MNSTPGWKGSSALPNCIFWAQFSCTDFDLLNPKASYPTNQPTNQPASQSAIQTTKPGKWWGSWRRREGWMMMMRGARMTRSEDNNLNSKLNSFLCYLCPGARPAASWVERWSQNVGRPAANLQRLKLLFLWLYQKSKLEGGWSGAKTEAEPHRQLRPTTYSL